MRQTLVLMLTLILSIVVAILIFIAYLSFRDPTGPICFLVFLWFVGFLTIATVSIPDGGSSFNSGRSSQIADYMATNAYFNNQAMRRDLDQMTQIAQRAEIQAQFDRTSKNGS